MVAGLQLTRWELARVRVMKVDTLVERKLTGREPVGGGVRGEITGLSRQARRRMLLVSRNCDCLFAEVTLTYPGAFPCEGRLVKYHVKRLLQELRRHGLAGLWFLEFQERGAPHFHLFVDGFVDRAWLAFTWYGIVGSEDERHLEAGTEVSRIRKPHAAAVYVAKYAAKMAQKSVPLQYRSVGRFWGRFGGLKVRAVELFTARAGDVIAQVRLVRRLYESTRRSWRVKDGKRSKRFRDNGRFSFVAWGLGGDWYRSCAVFVEDGLIIERRAVFV